MLAVIFMFLEGLESQHLLRYTKTVFKTIGFAPSGNIYLFLGVVVRFFVFLFTHLEGCVSV